MKFKLLVLVSSLVIICGCAPVPNNPTEFRATAEGKSKYYAKESVVVNRSVDQVEKILKQKVKECLSSTVVVTRTNLVATGGSGGNNAYREKQHQYNIHYTNEIVKSKDRLELYVRNSLSGSVVTLGKTLDGGFYILVVDVTPVSKKQSKLDIYYLTTREILVQTLKDWMSGKTEGCPDLSESF